MKRRAQNRNDGFPAVGAVRGRVAGQRTPLARTEAFYFGEVGKQLFGLYHPADESTRRDCGVVLCDPLGQEQIRIHRAFLVLAQRLARAGFDTLRFNYYGCADSEGEGEDADFDQWRRDISTAIDELERGCGVSRLCLVGLRLGASLAMLAGAERGDIEAAVLWDPVVSGRAYLAELEAAHRDWLRGSFAGPSPDRAGIAVRETLGFPLPEPLITAIDRFEAASITTSPAHRVLLIDTESEMAARSLLGPLVSLGARTEHRYLPAPPVWRKPKEGEEFGQGLVPVPILDSIVSWIATADA